MYKKTGDGNIFKIFPQKKKILTCALYIPCVKIIVLMVADSTWNKEKKKTFSTPGWDQTFFRIEIRAERVSIATAAHYVPLIDSSPVVWNNTPSMGENRASDVRRPFKKQRTKGPSRRPSTLAARGVEKKM